MKKIFLIGDSIRMGYDSYVKMAFEGLAEVYYPNENCRFSTYVLRSISDWHEWSGCGDDVDVVHWNAGLWDALKLADGKLHVSLREYKRNVKRIYFTLKKFFPKAKFIFATSTPVQEELFTGDYKRYNKDTIKFNKAAVKISQKNGAEINDLYTLVEGLPKCYYSDRTHLYTKGGTKAITSQVANCIGEALDITPKMLDYDALFADKEEIIGI